MTRPAAQLALALRLALRQSRVSWRELAGLVLALVVGISALVAVSAFTDRVGRGLQLNAAALLGGDLAVIADRPIPLAFAQEAQRRGLRSAQTAGFPSMVLAGERDKLVELKAVGAGFPLRGELRVEDGRGRSLAGIPAPGTVWVQPDLLAQLGVRIGDALQVGERSLRIAGVILEEPSSGGGLFSIGPRVMLNWADLAGTGLIQYGSRVGYRLLLAGGEAEVKAYRQWAKSRLQRGMRLEGVTDARPELRMTLERAERFLGLAALSALLLAGIAVATSVRSFVARRLDAVAVLRCLGAGSGLILAIYLSQVVLLGVLGTGLGVLLGYLLQGALPALLGGVLPGPLPPPSWLPAGVGLAMGLSSVIIFALPPLLRLRRVPALRVLRRDLESTGRLDAATALVYLLSAALLVGLVLWQAGDLRLGLYTLAAVLGTVVVLAGLGYGLIVLISRLRIWGGVSWRFGLANLARPGNRSIGQILAFGIGLLALLSITVVQGDLFKAWQHQVPPDAPNHFVINILPDQQAEIAAFFRGQGLPPPALYPMVRARLVAIDGKPLRSIRFKDRRSQALATREFNLSWAARPQADNVVTAGRWWAPAQRGQAILSVEEGIAEALGVRVGSTLRYDIAGQPFEARIVNLRRVNWDSFNVNFFVVAPPGVLDSFPATYVTSFHLPPGRARFSSELVARLPNLTVIDVGAVLAQVQQVLTQIREVVGFVFLFTLLAGFVVLLAAIQATQGQRSRDAALLRTLGARAGQLRAAAFAEFAAIGLAAGLIAALGATVLTGVLSVRIFELPFRPNPWLWLWGPGLGSLGIGLAGMLGLRRVLATPPLQVLR